LKNNDRWAQFFVDRNTHSGKIDFDFRGENERAMKVLKQEGRKKLGKKPEYKKLGPPIAFGMP
jgi:hypothetical protein